MTVDIPLYYPVIPEQRMKGNKKRSKDPQSMKISLRGSHSEDHVTLGTGTSVLGDLDEENSLLH